jgi:hypothetical protein
MTALLLAAAVVTLLTARRDTSNALTPAQLWRQIRAHGWWTIPLALAGLAITWALVTGWAIAGLAWPATWLASRILAGAALVLAAVAAHIRLLYPPIPARQEPA